MAKKQNQALDINFVRDQFPALQKSFIFMDNAGGSQILGSTVNYITEYLTNYNVQIGASYQVSADAGEKLNFATAQVAQYINAPNPKEIVIGPSSSMLLRILSLCISANWKSGDEVIVTNTDHEANVSCWTDLEEKGIKTKIWKINRETLQLEIEELKELLNPKTKLVAVTHASNVLGTINPIKEIAKVVHEAGALICVDGVAYAPHRKIDVQDLDVDFYTFSWYKVFGPHLAVMFGKLPLLTKMKGINHFFFKPEDVPYKFQPGNFNFELTYSLLGIPEHFSNIYNHHFAASSEKIPEEEKLEKVFELVSNYEEKLAEKLLSYLRSKSEIQIIGVANADASKRVPTISFVHKNLNSEEIVKKVDSYGIGIRFGDFYAKKLIHDLDLEKYRGVVRVSLVHYNTKEEVEKLISAFEDVL